MSDPMKPALPPQVSCGVCRKEIPRSAAIKDEARDYVYYFCGGECYQAWLGRSAERGSNPAASPPDK